MPILPDVDREARPCWLGLYLFRVHNSRTWHIRRTVNHLWRHEYRTLRPPLLEYSYCGSYQCNYRSSTKEERVFALPLPYIKEPVMEWPSGRELGAGHALCWGCLHALAEQTHVDLPRKRFLAVR